MYGWRGRFGHVSPAIYDIQSLEFQQLLPDGVLVVKTCLNVQNLTKIEFERAFALMEQSAVALAREGVGAILIGGDPIFCFVGKEKHQELIDTVYSKTKIPTSTTLSASIHALKSLNIKRLVIATPYAPERNKSLCEYFEESGFEVLGIKGLGITRNADLNRVPFHAAYQLAVETFKGFAGAEGIYIPCPRWPVVGSIGPLEKDLGAFVVTSIQAMAWFGLKSLGIKEEVKGYGTLLEKLSDTTGL